ncbi:DNA-binding response regulator [candidate division KSB1 bacterium]|nr:MAG: DNA-binding response regulator [candidate division KSB1 bacterium]
MAIKILLADDHQIIRDGLASLLEKQKDMQVVGQAEDGRQALRMAVDLKPDIVVMDISMPNLNGIEAAAQLRKDCPGTRVIALSMHADKRFVAGMLKAGAGGYLLKNSAFDDLVQAVSTVMAGEIYLSSKIAAVVIKDYIQSSRREKSADLDALSSRERETLQLLAEGKTTKQIAGELFISVKTVETHRQNVMKKLGISNLADLVKFAVREGLTSL